MFSKYLCEGTIERLCKLSTESKSAVVIAMRTVDVKVVASLSTRVLSETAGTLAMPSAKLMKTAWCCATPPLRN